MKTFDTISIWGDKLTFEYSKSFDLFGYTWTIHRPSYCERRDRLFVVSEIVTGLKLPGGPYKTAKTAETEARKFLRKKGEETVKKVVIKGRKKMTLMRKKARK